MAILSSGAWCDLCRKPILSGMVNECSINGKPGHACDACRAKHEKPEPKTEERGE